MNTVIGLIAVIGLAVILWKVWVQGVSEKKAEYYLDPLVKSLCRPN